MITDRVRMACLVAAVITLFLRNPATPPNEWRAATGGQSSYL